MRARPKRHAERGGGSGRRPRGGHRYNRNGREWVGGRLSPPFFVMDREEPYRPPLVVWMEAGSGLVVGHDVVAPEDADGAVARVLRAAMDRPLAGPPRRPDRIRVADASLAAEVRAAVGTAIPVEVAPTPELDEILEAMVESMPGDDKEESYLERGRIPAGSVARLFSVASVLYTVAPWKVATDSQVLRMDVPALGIDGACVSIIGNLGKSLGFLIFPSLAGYEAFRQVAEEARPERGRIDLGTGWLALSFERGADLPPPMRREVASHGWPVADAKAYPRIERRECDGASRPLVERDVKIASACATSLSAFFLRHERLFESDAPEPVCESLLDENDLEVRFTFPYEAFPLFDIEDVPVRREAPRPARPKAGRNDPCPCGSGRKYKKCHLPLEEAERAPAAARPESHDLDSRLVRELVEFAVARFGGAWWRFEEDFEDVRAAWQLAVPWSLYQFRVEGRSVLEAYLEERGRRCSPAERAWLAAQKAAWLSVWEVSAVEPGRTVTVRDLLSEEVRCVREASGSKTVVARDAILARVVDQGGDSVLCGVHPRPLPPFEAAEVVRRARRRLRRKRAVPPEQLRDEAFGRYLIRRWEEAVAALDARASVPPDLRNTDDEPLLLTTDHFEIRPGARRGVEAHLAALHGVEPPGPGEDPPEYVFLRRGSGRHLPAPQSKAARQAGPSLENTLIGRAWLRGNVLALETNSLERADALRERVEAACGGLIRHRVREHADPLSTRAADETPDEPPEPPPPEAAAFLLDLKKRHYADWADQALPALGGKTPREASRTAGGRAAVDLLLKDMENREQRFAGPEDRFDFTPLRRKLGLEP